MEQDENVQEQEFVHEEGDIQPIPVQEDMVEFLEGMQYVLSGHCPELLLSVEAIVGVGDEARADREAMVKKGEAIKRKQELALAAVKTIIDEVTK